MASHCFSTLSYQLATLMLVIPGSIQTKTSWSKITIYTLATTLTSLRTKSVQTVPSKISTISTVTSIINGHTIREDPTLMGTDRVWSGPMVGNTGAI